MKTSKRLFYSFLFLLGLVLLASCSSKAARQESLPNQEEQLDKQVPASNGSLEQSIVNTMQCAVFEEVDFSSSLDSHELSNGKAYILEDNSVFMLDMNLRITNDAYTHRRVRCVSSDPALQGDPEFFFCETAVTIERTGLRYNLWDYCP